MSIRCNSYFSGAGLMDLGLIRGGIDIQQSFELDGPCCDTLRHNFDHQVVQCDISDKLVMDEMDADCMVGTYPCTKYSAIADLFGNKTGDDLFLHFFRHLAIKRPEVYAIENVPSMRYFPVVMEAMSKLPDYYVSVFCPVTAEEVGLPQRRERLILIGSKKPFSWRKPEGIPLSPLSQIIERGASPEITEAVKNRLAGKYRDMPIVSDPERGDIAPCCVAHYHRDRSTRLVKDGGVIRPYTVKEYARLQGVPDSFQFMGTRNDQYKQIGNGVPVGMGEWLGREFRRYFQA